MEMGTYKYVVVDDPEYRVMLKHVNMGMFHNEMARGHGRVLCAGYVQIGEGGVWRINNPNSASLGIWGDADADAIDLATILGEDLRKED